MKTTKLFAIAMTATLLLASCGKEETGTETTAGEKAKMTINVVAPTNRASVTAPQTVPADDKTITSYVAFVFGADRILQDRVVVTTPSTPLVTDKVTTSAAYVYVIANADLYTEFPGTAGTTTISDLEAYVADLAVTNKGSQLATRWAAGVNDAPIAFSQNSAGDFSSNVSVTMNFIAARVTVKVTPMSDYDNTKSDGSLVMTDVYLLNAGAGSRLFGTSLAAAAPTLPNYTHYAGVSMTGFQAVPANYTTLAGLKDDISAVAKADFASKTFYYYSFENNAVLYTANPVIAVIEGTYDGRKIYFQVHLAPYENFSTGAFSTASVLRGYSYDISIKLTGKASIVDGGTYPGQTGGGTDPTVPLVNAAMTVDLSINDWIPVVLEKEFK